MRFHRHIFAVLVLALASVTAFGQVKEPPRTEKVEVQIHYRIRAERDERVRQYRALERFLQSLGFDDARKDDPNRDLDIFDVNHERFTGSIPSARVLELLNEPHILNIIFAPSGYMYPDSGDKTISIRVTLRGGLPPAAQQALLLQTLDQLEKLGFKDALAYDTRGNTQLKGTIPYKSLERLFNDLRYEPSGWFLPNTPPDRLPRPLADRNPIRWVEVMPAVEPPPTFAPEPVLPARVRLSPELRAKLVDPTAKEMPLFVEVVFAGSMADSLEELRRRLDLSYGPSARKNPDGTPAKSPDGRVIFTEGVTIEGAVGNVVTLRFDRPEDAERISQEPDVLSVRLPRGGVETVLPLAAETKLMTAAELLKTSGVDALQKLGYRGQGVRVVVIGTDFTGADKLIGTTLPRKTRILDLTTELHPDIRPLPADGSRAAASIAVARAVAISVPDAELVLVRINPFTFFQLAGIVRVAHGDTAYSTAMRSRLIDLTRQSEVVSKHKDVVTEEYRRAFEDLADDEPTRLRRARAKTALDAVIGDQEALTQRIERFNAFQRLVTGSLGGARVIVNPLVWEAGYPLDGLSDLSRALELDVTPPPPRTVRPATGPRSLPKPPILWVQAASPSVNAVWGAPFRDVDGNGTMEFALPGQPLPPGNWSHELNFLGLRGPMGEIAPDLPAGTRIRFTMQWREPRDPRLPNADIPAYPIVLRIFRQLDPTGEKRPSDEMGEDARSAGGPYPIYRTTNSIVYEQILDFTAPAAGRFACVVSMGYRPEALLPALKRTVEISPRIVVESLAGKPGENPVVFRSYQTPHGGVGIPADSKGVVTVGVPDGGSLTGGGTGVALLVKPDLLGPDALDLGDGVRGPGVATGYAAGVLAALAQADRSGGNVFQSAGLPAGKFPVVPEHWLRYLPSVPRTGEK